MRIGAIRLAWATCRYDGSSLVELANRQQTLGAAQLRERVIGFTFSASASVSAASGAGPARPAPIRGDRAIETNADPTTRPVVAECCCVVLLVGVEHHPERTVCGSVVGVRARVVVRLLHLLLDCGQSSPSSRGGGALVDRSSE